MKFQVPQYIEVEDKIFGPLTLRQFVYVLGSAGLTFIFYRFLGIFGLVLGIPILIFGVLLAFYKHNNRPFAFFVESALRYAINKKLYLWRKTEKLRERRHEESGDSVLFIPKLRNDTLKDMTWGIDAQEHVRTARGTAYHREHESSPPAPDA